MFYHTWVASEYVAFGSATFILEPAILVLAQEWTICRKGSLWLVLAFDLTSSRRFFPSQKEYLQLPKLSCLPLLFHVQFPEQDEDP